MTRVLTACLLVSIAASACASGAVPVTTPEDGKWAASTWPDASPGQLQHGREAYVRRCSGCHALVPPANHTPARWQMEVAQMAEKAHLVDADRAAILRYLLTVSRSVTVDQHPPTPQRSAVVVPTILKQ